VDTAHSIESDSTADAVVIRGVKLPLTDLVDRDALGPEALAEFQRRLRTARPFPHLVIDGLFNPDLLDLIAEEFDSTDWRGVTGRHQRTLRSVDCPNLGSAAQLYFDTIYSGWFIDWLSMLTGVDHLLTDPKLVDGGLHETRRGGSFGVHRDFERHRKNGLRNEMVLITYLNKSWQEEWGGQLELWTSRRRVTQVFPVFGRTLLMIHGPASFHGHPEPLHTPEGRSRRSVASYFYTSPESAGYSQYAPESNFLHVGWSDHAKQIARLITPPALYLGARSARDRMKRRHSLSQASEGRAVYLRGISRQ